MSKVFRALISIVVPTTVIVGHRSGVTTSQTICNSLAPSILAASSTSVLMALRLAEMMTMQKPTAVQTPTKMRAALLVVDSTSHGTGSRCATASRALRVPVWVAPVGWYSNMNFQMIDAATALIGTGRKIAILASGS